MRVQHLGCSILNPTRHGSVTDAAARQQPPGAACCLERQCTSISCRASQVASRLQLQSCVCASRALLLLLVFSVGFLWDVNRKQASAPRRPWPARWCMCLMPVQCVRRTGLGVLPYQRRNGCMRGACRCDMRSLLTNKLQAGCSNNNRMLLLVRVLLGLLQLPVRYVHRAMHAGRNSPAGAQAPGTV